MRTFWVQLVALSLYFEIVFVISRLWNLVLWCQQGAPPTQAVDPLLLSVKQLKLLLDSRGVNYTGYLEKSELAQLVSDSAVVVKSEVEHLAGISGILEDGIAVSQKSSYFTGRGHFYEEVEDSRDSVWLVQVMSSNEPLLDDYNWRRICSQVEPFGIRTGVFDCRLDQRLCDSKGWRQPLLLLAMPKGTKPKDKVVLRTFFSKKPQVIMDWVRQKLSVWVKKLKDIEEVKKDWLHLTEDSGALKDNPTTDSSTRTVQVLLLSHLIQPPLFLVALSIKFSGRVRFGMLTVRREESEAVRREVKLPVKNFPCYLIITPEQTVVYGKQRLEHFNFWSMNVFLRTVQPEMNDIFLCSLALVNMMVILQSLQVSAQRRWCLAVKRVWIFMVHNLLLFSTWLTVLAIGRFPFTSLLAEKLLLAVRVISLSTCGSLLRADWSMILQHPILLILSFLAYAFCVAKTLPADIDSERQHWWELFPNDSYWVNCLFGNMASLSHSLQPSLGWEADHGIEEFIERLPNIWQQPTVPTDYVTELPVWRFRPDSNQEMPHSSDLNDPAVASDDHDAAQCSCQEARSSQHSGGSFSSHFATRSARRDSEHCKKCNHLSSCRRRRNKSSPESDCCSSVSEESDREDLGYEPPPWILSTTMCAICLEPYHEGTKLCGLPCGHNYHHRCISVWIMKDHHHCPVCRWPAFRSKAANLSQSQDSSQLSD